MSRRERKCAYCAFNASAPACDYRAFGALTLPVRRMFTRTESWPGEIPEIFDRAIVTDAHTRARYVVVTA